MATQLQLIGLVRVSGPGQQADGTPETQRVEIQEIARDHEAKLVDVVEIQLSVSGLAASDAWQQRILPRLHDPDVHLAVFHADRLARPNTYDPRETAALWDIERTGTRIYLSEGRVRDLSTREGYREQRRDDDDAGAERDKIIMRTTKGRIRASREGRAATGGPNLPTGIAYTTVRDTVDGRRTKVGIWGYSDDAWRPREAFRLLVEEGHSYAAIAEAVGQSVFPVRRWLTSPIYKGMYATKWQGDHEPVRVYGGPGQEPQLVSDAVWDAAQAIIAERASGHRRSRASRASNLIYSGHLWSGYEAELGLAERPDGLTEGTITEPTHTLYGHTTYGRRGATAYACRCQHECWDPRCGLMSWAPAERLHKGLDVYLTRETRTEIVLSKLRTSVEVLRMDAGGDAKAVESQLSQVLRRLKKLEDAYLDGDFTRDRYIARKEDYRVEERRLRTQLDRHDKAPQVPSEDEMIAAADRVAWDASWDGETKRAWLHRHRVAIWLRNDGIATAMLRFPSPVLAGLCLYVTTEEASWTDLVGHDLSDHYAVLEAEEGLYTSARVAEEVGITPDALKALRRARKVARPAHPSQRPLLWTRDELEAVRVVVSGSWAV